MPRCPVCSVQTATRSRIFPSSVWQVWACETCGLDFVWPVPPPVELRRYYRWPDYGSQIYRDIGLARNRKRALYREILRYAGDGPPHTPRRTLDVGCGSGQFLRVARKFGWVAEGLEWDPETAARARAATGVTVHDGDGLTAVPIGRTYDLILMSHWLEHLEHPLDALQAARSLLAPGGVVVLRVPDARCPLAVREGVDWTWFCPPIHLQYFSEVSIRGLVREAGLVTRAVRHIRGDAHQALVERLLAALKSARRRAGSSAVIQMAPEGSFAKLAWVGRRLVEAADAWPPQLTPLATDSLQEILAVASSGHRP